MSLVRYTHYRIHDDATRKPTSCGRAGANRHDGTIGAARRAVGDVSDIGCCLAIRSRRPPRPRSIPEQLEWHPTRNALRPDQVTRASGREVVWQCESGHAWSAAVYQRTLSGSGCSHCYRLTAAARSGAGKQRARRASDDAAMTRVVALRPLAAGDSEAV